MRFIALFCALLALPAAANAEWYEASSTNFVVYANDSERDLRKFTEQLERYHQAMLVVTNLELPAPSPSNRLTVYVVGNVSRVQRLFGEGGRSIGGFYVPRAGGSAAFVPNVRVGSGALDYSMHTLLHEYAHHILLSNSAYSPPRWLGEGGAEFFSGARFTDDGGLTMGLYESYSYFQFRYLDNVTAEKLLDPEKYADNVANGRDSFYGKSWLLYHYLTFDEERRGQLRQYIGLMQGGKSSREAALEAFGNLRTLEVELSGYMNRPRMLSLVFAPGQLEAGPVAIRKLSEGEAKMMPVRMVSRRGVNSEQALELVPDAREIAERYPGDPAVLAALAEVELDAGNLVEAIAAADAAIAADPSQVNAYLQKGYALFRRAYDAEEEGQAAAYRAAVAPFLALNKIEPDHPLPLFYYYSSFSARGADPPEVAVRGLERALELAPFDFGLRMNLVTQQIKDRNYQAARVTLRPVAYNPHGGSLADVATKVIEFLETNADPEPDAVLAIFGGPAEGEVEASADGAEELSEGEAGDEPGEEDAGEES